MGGCLRALGLLILLALAVAGGWLLRGWWTSRDQATEPAAVVVNRSWEPPTADGAERTRAALDKLRRRSGPVFVSLPAADVVAYLQDQISEQLLPSAENVTAAAIDDQLRVRATVDLSAIDGAGVLGPLAGMLGEREPIEFGGVVDVVRPGLAQYRVRTVKLRDFSVPSAVIPRIIRAIRPEARSTGLAADGLPLEIPEHVADVRIADGQVTLYKAVK
jgi:hypothetical protein